MMEVCGSGGMPEPVRLIGQEAHDRKEAVEQGGNLAARMQPQGSHSAQGSESKDAEPDPICG